MSLLLLAQEAYQNVPSPAVDTGSSSTVSLFNWHELIVEPLKRFVVNLSEFIPNVLIALCTLALGFLLAKLLQYIVFLFLRSVGFEKFCRKTGITDLLTEGKEQVDENRWFGLMTFWVVFFISFTVSLDQLRLGALSVQLGGFLQFVATGIKVLVTFVVGIFLILISSRIVRTTADTIKIPHADVYARLVQVLVAALIILVGLGLIGLQPQIVLAAVGVAFVALCVTFVIAFGLGGAGWAGKVLDRSFFKDKK
jgi:hypothetical protein